MKAPFPSNEEILEYIRESPGRVGKREIARAFQLDAEQKKLLKKVLKQLQEDGLLQRGRGRRFAESGTLPEVTVIQISGLDPDGEVLARPLKWNDEDGEAPRIYMAPEKRGGPALGIGDRVLARLSPAKDGVYEGKVIRRLASAPPKVLGIFDVVEGEGRIRPTDKRAKSDFMVATGDAMGAEPGELVRAEIQPGRRLGLRKAKVIERLDRLGGPRSVSLIAIHDHDVPTEFTPDALRAAEEAGPAPLDGRVDLREIPLVTIDGADARDFDDAVWAEADEAPENPGGWHLMVAIADVSWYVRPRQALDRCAYERGNSAYFPDRVVPMLPEALSNGWCSLNPDEDRSCLAAHLWIDAAGNLLRHRFVRGLMRSAARLTYEEVQHAHDEGIDPLGVIEPLYGAYGALAKNRAERGVLDLDMPEKKVELDEKGNVAAIVTRPRFDSHRLIEEFMITANVAAAETLERLRQPCMYRIHDEPSKEKVENLREVLDGLGIRFSRGQVAKPGQFNAILKKVDGSPNAHLVNEMVLRSQAQAEYAPENIGHFGLALRRYCHFTSPIRRYADLLVHRALIRGLKLGEGALEDDPRDFEEMGEHISTTERRAAAAERDAVDRFVAAFMADKVGSVFSGRITGVTRFGLFVALDESGADGLVPIRSLAEDYYIHDEKRHELRGRHNGLVYRLGDKVECLLLEATPLTGGLVLQVLEDGSAPPRRKGKGKGPARGRGKPKRGRRR